jgi:hypothetical protein
VATRCTSVDQFVATFHRFCGDDQTFFVATLTSRPIGLETPFSIQLADKQPVLRGLCIVLDAWTTADNRYRRPGIRLGIRRLTAESQVVFDRLRAASRPALASEATPWPGAAPRAPRPRTRPPAFALRTGATPHSVRVPLPLPPGDLPAIRATPLPPELPASVAPVAVTRFQIALNVGEHPPSVHDVEFKPIELAPRQRTDPRIISGPPAPEEIDPREPALIVDRPIAPDPVDPVDRVDAGDLAAPSDGSVEAAEAEAEARVTEPVTAEPEPADERTPGSAFVLPANPLQNLSDESLEGFVDCTLYEEAVNVFHPGIDDRGWADATGESLAAGELAAGRPATVPAMPFDAAPELMVRSLGATESLAVAASPRPAPPPIYPLPALPALPALPFSRDPQAMASGSQALPVRAETGSMPPYTASPPSGSWPPYGHAVSPSGAWPPYPQPGSPSGAWPPHATPADFATPARPSTPPPMAAPITTLLAGRSPGPAGLADWRRWLLIGGTAVIAIILAFLLARLARGPVGAAPATTTSATSKSASRTPPVPVMSRTATTPPALRGESAGSADPDDEIDEAMLPPGSIPVVGSGPCRFTVAAAPAGSLVRLDDDPLGASPLTIETTCANHKIEVSHARYQTITRSVTLAADRAERVELSLPRPLHAVAIASSPSGAAIAIDGRRVGTTPAVVQLPGFAQVHVTLTKPGFRPTTRRIYSKLAQDRVVVKLAK